jgi:hypothetical protein
MCDTIKPKIIHNKKILFNILSFSHNRFLSNRKKRFPPFAPNGWTDQVENVFGDTSTNLWCILFGDISYQSNLAGFVKCLRFSEILIILVLLPEISGIFQKKNIPHDWVPLPTVKISTQTDEICGIARGTTLGRFLDLVVCGSPRR